MVGVGLDVVDSIKKNHLGLNVQAHPQKLTRQSGGAILFAILALGLISSVAYWQYQKSLDELLHQQAVARISQQQRIAQYYVNIFRNQVAKNKTFAHYAAFRNAAFPNRSPLSDPPANTGWSPLALFDSSGTKIIPESGLYLDDSLNPVSAAGHARWKIECSWRGVDDPVRTKFRIRVTHHADSLFPIRPYTMAVGGRNCVTNQKRMVRAVRFPATHPGEHSLAVNVTCPLGYEPISSYVVDDPRHGRMGTSITPNGAHCGGWARDALGYMPTIGGTPASWVDVARTPYPTNWRGEEPLPGVERNSCFVLCCQGD